VSQPLIEFIRQEAPAAKRHAEEIYLNILSYPSHAPDEMKSLLVAAAAMGKSIPADVETDLRIIAEAKAHHRNARRIPNLVELAKAQRQIHNQASTNARSGTATAGEVAEADSVATAAEKELQDARDSSILLARHRNARPDLFSRGPFVEIDGNRHPGDEGPD
jgi:hypothetical protein